MRERNGVRIGQRVVDLDGTSLGRVVDLYDWGFATQWGLPVFWHREYVLRYDEVRGARGGALVVSRSSRDLAALAAGAVPPAWRIPTPPEYPRVATPFEARDLLADLAGGRVTGASPATAGEAEVSPAATTVTEAEVRTYPGTRGESVAPAQSDRP
jgi:hypothetical protein